MEMSTTTQTMELTQLKGKTMSELVESALRQLLRPSRKRVALPPLPTFDGGGSKVDISDRDALYDAMEQRSA